MKRRRLLLATALAPAAGPALSALPAVLQRAATPTPLAGASALLAATRAGDRLVVAGERGIVLFSDDRGQRWTQARVPVQVSITSLAFAGAQQVWAAGHFGVLLHSSDAGASWQLVMDGVRAAQLQLQGAADDAQRQAAQRKVDEGADKPWLDIDATGGRLLAVGAYGMALESRDGKTFHSLAARLPNPRQLHLYGVRTAGERVFIVGEQGLLLRSTDGGARFEALPSPYKGSFFGVLLGSGGSVLAYGLRGNVWRSADNGNSWTQLPVPVPVSLSAATRMADGTIVLVAQNGDLLVSRDDGLSLRHLPAAQPFPAAALAAADRDALVLAGLRGVQRRALA